MKLKKDKFDKAVEKHKELLNKCNKTFKNKEQAEDGSWWMIAKLKQQAKELSLVQAEFKCQKCQSEERLSWHHLVLQKAQEFMPFDRYINARYYWNSLIILCWKCHKEYHFIMDKGKTDEKETDIDKSFILKLKKEYYDD